MSATLKCRIEHESAISEYSSISQYKIVIGLFSDVMTVANLSLLGNRLSHQMLEQRSTTLMLSDVDKSHFLKSLKTPPESNKKLKKAIERYYEIK